MVEQIRSRNLFLIHQHNIPWNGIPGIKYLHAFTHTSEGFSALASAAKHKLFTEAIVKAAMDLVHLAAGQDEYLTVKPIEPRLPALLGFLDVVSAVAKYCSLSAHNDMLLIQFGNNTLNLIKAAMNDSASRPTILQHPACQDLWEAALTIDDQAKDELIEGLWRLQADLGVDFESEFAVLVLEHTSYEKQTWSK
ncbi:hypothetical protein FRC07_005257 [Ceratobasidium sp. 392]|nr:hypothetical protein FRC07_005257 [Ceratobasidium sp. 392]